jgi:two-component system response regulator PilR (NtrC family)
LSAGGEIGVGDLRLHPAGSEKDAIESASMAEGELPAGPLPAYLDKVERDAILAALAKTNFNRTAAAKLLGLTFRTLRYRMQRLGIKEPEA